MCRKIISSILLVCLLVVPAPALAARPPRLTVGQYLVQYRGFHTHPLGACEPLPVKHGHFDVFRVGKPNTYVIRFHVGWYVHPVRGVCWLAYQSQPPASCVNPCRHQRGGGGNGLRQVVTVSVQEVVRAGRLILTGVAILALIGFMVAHSLALCPA